MIWLLDVNALVALAHQDHREHSKVIAWFGRQHGTGSEFATCAITELGFTRVSIQAGLEIDVPGAIDTLQGLKASSKMPFRLLSDALGADQLPAYVKGHKQITDGHLRALADTHGARLATLDKSIPKACVIA